VRTAANKKIFEAAEATINSTSNLLTKPSKSTIVNLFNDKEVVKNGKVNFGESFCSKKCKDLPRRTWSKFDIGEAH
jgi:hypothetical protein